MNLRFTLLATFALCLAFFVPATAAPNTGTANDALKGPCNRATPTYPTFDCTQDDCEGWLGSCDDGPLRLITWAPGTCGGEEGGCQLINTTKNKYARVRCDCQDDGVTCEMWGYTYSDTTTVTDCVVVAVDGE